MKSEEKKALYHLFRVALDAMEGFKSASPYPIFTDDTLHEKRECSEPPNTIIDASYSNIEISKVLNNKKIYNSIEEIKADVLTCKACQLCKSKVNIVFGEGPKETIGLLEHPPVLVIGEAPGYDDDIQGRPFVGASGKLLDKMLNAIELSRTKNCFITNIVKCRPPENRNPGKDEIIACSHFLEEQIRLLSPKIILLLGTVALKSLFNTEKGISHLHGKLFYYNDTIPTIATYHPSALLRNESLKRPAWDDLKFFRSKLQNL